LFFINSHHEAYWLQKACLTSLKFWSRCLKENRISQRWHPRGWMRTQAHEEVIMRVDHHLFLVMHSVPTHERSRRCWMGSAAPMYPSSLASPTSSRNGERGSPQRVASRRSSSREIPSPCAVACSLPRSTFEPILRCPQCKEPFEPCRAWDSRSALVTQSVRPVTPLAIHSMGGSCGVMG